MSNSWDVDFCPNCGKINCPDSCYFAKKDEDNISDCFMDHLPLSVGIILLILSLGVAAFLFWLIIQSTFALLSSFSF